MANKQIVWDGLVRVFHWSLLGFFALAYWTENDWLGIHSNAGYTIFLLLVFRIVWGLIGSHHARFVHFIASPFSAVRYLKQELQGKAEPHLGHNPAGAVMVVVLLLLLFSDVFSGMVLFATEGRGPLADTGLAMWPAVFVELAHGILVHTTMVMVGLHVLGVLFSSFKTRQNLIWSMITGKKPMGKTIDKDKES